MCKLSSQLLIMVLVIFGLSSAHAETQAENFVKNIVENGSNHAGDLNYFCERVHNLLTLNTISKMIAGDKHKAEYDANKSLFQSFFAAKLALEANERVQPGVVATQTQVLSSKENVTLVSAKLSNDKTVKYKLYQVGESFKIIDFFTQGRWLVDYYKDMFDRFPERNFISMARRLAQHQTCEDIPRDS